MPLSNQSKVVITGLGHFHPENVIENAFFDSLDIGSNASWVEERTGIRARRSIIEQNDLNALRHGRKTLEDLRQEGRVMGVGTMGEKAWNLLKSRTPNAADRVDFVSCGTSVPDYDIPANACVIANKIGLECASFDVNSACSSFVVNLHTSRALIKSGAFNKGVVFIPERYSLRLDYRDRGNCVLFGDGCAAALLETNAPGGLEVIDTLVNSAPSKFDLVQIPDSSQFSQNGKAVQKFAITRTIEITLEILEKNKFTLTDVDHLVGHQANLRMLTSAIEKLGLPPHKHLYNVDQFGNQGGAGAPCVLSMNWEKFKSGDLIVVSVVGSGLTWASALLRKL